MPASDGASFVSSMDKMLCSMERDLKLSATEVGGIREELTRDLRAIGQSELGNLGTIRQGGTRILTPSAQTVRALGATSQRSEDRFSRFRLQWLNRDQLAERVSAGFSSADRAEFHRHSNRLARNAREFLREIAELEPSLEDEVEATIAQMEDAKNDLLKLEVKSFTSLTEHLGRAANNGMTRAEASEAINTFDINRGLFNQSLLEHPQGVVRGLLAGSSERMAQRISGVTGPRVVKRAFMIPAVCPGGNNAVLLNPGGRTAELAWRVMSVEQLATRAAGLATVTQAAGGGFRTLGEGVGTREFYVPIPPENLDEVKELMKERRATFLAEGGDQ